MGSVTIYDNSSINVSRIERVDIEGEVYHVINRANARVKIFDDTKDYKQFEKVLLDGVERFNMRILAYSIMPNHWHLILYTKMVTGPIYN